MSFNSSQTWKVSLKIFANSFLYILLNTRTIYVTWNFGITTPWDQLLDDRSFPEVRKNLSFDFTSCGFGTINLVSAIRIGDGGKWSRKIDFQHTKTWIYLQNGKSSNISITEEWNYKIFRKNTFFLKLLFFQLSPVFVLDMAKPFQRVAPLSFPEDILTSIF